MSHWLVQRHAHTLAPMTKPTDSPHVLTAHNTNTPSRIPSSTAYDDSLTNLSWLHDINIFKRTMPTIKRSEPASSTEPEPVEHQEIDDDQWRAYRNQPNVKPTYSHYQLIVLAMRHSGAEKMTLAMIYDWIVDNFPYFKKLDATWQVFANDVHQLFSAFTHEHRLEFFFLVAECHAEENKQQNTRVAPHRKLLCLSSSIPFV